MKVKCTFAGMSESWTFSQTFSPLLKSHIHVVAISNLQLFHAQSQAMMDFKKINFSMYVHCCFGCDSLSAMADKADGRSTLEVFCPKG